MSNNPKILLAAPINIVKAYCLFGADGWLNAIKELDYDNYDIMLVDNSPSPVFAQKIRDLDFYCSHLIPDHAETRYLLLHSLDIIRDRVLLGSYDFFFSLECDVFPQKDIIHRLLAHNKDIVGTTYWTGHGYNSYLNLQILDILHKDYENHKLESKVRDMSFEEAQLFMDGTCKPVYANGIGCALISREIVENIPFRIDPADSGFPDSFFHQDLWRNRIDNYVDTSIIPLHRNSNWSTILGDTQHKKLAASKGQMIIKK